MKFLMGVERQSRPGYVGTKAIKGVRDRKDWCNQYVVNLHGQRVERHL